MKKKRISICMKLIYCVLVCSFFSIAFSTHLLSHNNIRFERLTIADGLSQNTVFAILRDSRGFLWFGTEDGLNRYDGYTFKVFKNNPDDAETLCDNWIQTIYEDKSGVLWIGTHGGLERFNRKSQTFSHYIHNPKDPHSLSHNKVWSIYEDMMHVLWVGTDNGLNRFDREKNSFIRWENYSKSPDSLGSKRVKYICEDRLENLVVGTFDGGLNILDREKTLFTNYKHDPANPKSLWDNTVLSICKEGSGSLWLATYSGCGRFDFGKELFDYSINDILNLNIAVLSIYEDNDGILWIGTYGEGLYRFAPPQKNAIQYKQITGDPSSLSNNYVQSIYEDENGILWVGTNSGLNKFDKKKQKFGCSESEPNKPNYLSNNIWSIHEDRQGTLLIGTESGLESLVRNKKKFSRRKNGNHKFVSLENSKILSILEGENGDLWVGTLEDGLYRFNRNRKRLSHYKHEPSTPGSLSNNHINAIYEDKSGILWLGTLGGLNKFDKKNGTFYCYRNIPDNEESLSHNSVNAIYESKSGELWIGTSGGLNRFSRRGKVFTHWKRNPDLPKTISQNKISAIGEDKNGNLWIGTWGGGLNKFDRKQGTFKHYLEKDGLANGFIYSILGDKNGNLWMSTNKGLSKFNPERELFKNYDIRDGLQSNEFNTGAYFKSNDGEMFFGGINGFNAFYPHEITDNPHIPPVVITDFQILNESVQTGDKSPLKQSIIETKEITLSHKDYVFSFDFAALDFTNPGKNKYAYKMEGFDKDWVYRDAKKRFATYTNLDPGNYVFRVIGTNNDGVWNRKGSSIKIKIIPPFWKTWWFYLLAFVSFAILSYLIINFVKNYIILAGFWKKEKDIGKYRLNEKIGAGGMGTIYTANDTTYKSDTVAIKVLRDELFAQKSYRKRFVQEAAIVDQLDHPNIVRVIERGQHKQKLFIVMEFLKGQTLAKKIENESPIPLLDVLEIAIQMSATLTKIHHKNIVHRDLKPDNIMLVEKNGTSNFVKLLDFGLAKMQYQTRITQTGAVMGTINYMSPEQVSKGEFSPASDIYSLGAIFYESLTDKKLFAGDRVTDIMRQILEKSPLEPMAIRHDVPLDLNILIMKMLEKEPILRPGNDDIMYALKCLRNCITDHREIESTPVPQKNTGKKNGRSSIFGKKNPPGKKKSKK
ncbi:MAG: protein kinase [bacterium]|nr:protein kinase [bacterium]